MTDQPIPEKSIPDTLETVLAQLSTDQIRFVVARHEYATDKEAALAVGMKPDTVYHWPEIVREAVRLMAMDGMVTALHLRRRNLAKAMLVKVAGLDSDDERIQQGCATEIIEGEIGKAPQKTVISGPNGGPVAVTEVPFDFDTYAKLFGCQTESADGRGSPAPDGAGESVDSA